MGQEPGLLVAFGWFDSDQTVNGGSEVSNVGAGNL